MMIASNERRPLRMFVVHARGGGFFVALVPPALSPDQLKAVLNELEIEGARRSSLLRTSGCAWRSHGCLGWGRIELLPSRASPVGMRQASHLLDADHMLLVI